MARTTRRESESRRAATPAYVRPGIAIAGVTVLVALLLAVEVARLTAASALAGTSPDRAESLAPHLPAVLLSQAMAKVGLAAAEGRLPLPDATARLDELAETAPLEPAPFLVAAAVAQKRGDYRRAEALLLRARTLDPRSSAARYLLSDVWLRTGRIAEGLGEMVILTRLLHGTSVELVPALAEYAHTPGAAKQLASVLRDNPPFKSSLLAALASDPANMKLVMELDRATPEIQDRRSKTWQGLLIQGLIARGNYEEAYRLWQDFAHVSGPPPLLFNGAFKTLAAPAPFNWEFRSNSAGLAEPANGSIRVLYYGRDNVRLASQMLLLDPGRYRFSIVMSGKPSPGSLAWTITCAAGTELMRLDLSKGLSAEFTVPGSGCPAQAITLNGIGQDGAEESEIQLGPAKIERVR
jgi:tetratricopeptide (TPR) repeat protein